jgi:ribosomal protein L37AE/L43A
MRMLDSLCQTVAAGVQDSTPREAAYSQCPLLVRRLLVAQRVGCAECSVAFEKSVIRRMEADTAFRIIVRPRIQTADTASGDNVHIDVAHEPWAKHCLVCLATQDAAGEIVTSPAKRYGQTTCANNVTPRAPSSIWQCDSLNHDSSLPAHAYRLNLAKRLVRLTCSSSQINALAPEIPTVSLTANRNAHDRSLLMHFTGAPLTTSKNAAIS